LYYKRNKSFFSMQINHFSIELHLSKNCIMIVKCLYCLYLKFSIPLIIVHKMCIIFSGTKTEFYDIMLISFASCY
jgi:hypothetical protein